MSELSLLLELAIADRDAADVARAAAEADAVELRDQCRLYQEALGLADSAGDGEAALADALAASEAKTAALAALRQRVVETEARCGRAEATVAHLQRENAALREQQPGSDVTLLKRVLQEARAENASLAARLAALQDELARVQAAARECAREQQAAYEEAWQGLRHDMAALQSAAQAP